MIENKKLAWVFVIGVLFINAMSLLLCCILVFITSTRLSATANPGDVFDKLVTIEEAIVIAAPDRWTKTEQQVFAELNNLRMPTKEELLRAALIEENE